MLEEEFGSADSACQVFVAVHDPNEPQSETDSPLAPESEPAVASPASPAVPDSNKKSGKNYPMVIEAIVVFEKADALEEALKIPQRFIKVLCG